MRYIRLRDILKLDTSKEEDQKKLEKMAEAIKADGLCKDKSNMEVYTRLDRIRKFRDMQIECHNRRP